MERVLLLNADYQPLSLLPLSTIPWQDAIKLVYEDVLVVVKESERQVHSPSVTINVPSVVALKKYAKKPHHVPMTRYNFYLRDGFQCQYCGEHYDIDELTLDHVLPKSAGGQWSWENLTTACVSCNTEKGNDVRGWVPLNKPVRPSYYELVKKRQRLFPERIEKDWEEFITLRSSED